MTKFFKYIYRIAPYLLVVLFAYGVAMTSLIDSRIPSMANACRVNIRQIFAQIKYNEIDGKKTPVGVISKNNYKAFGLDKYPVCPYLFMTKKSGDEYSIKEKNNQYKVKCKYHGTIEDIDKYFENYNSFWEKSKRQLWVSFGSVLFTLIFGFIAVFVIKYLIRLITSKLKK